MTKEMQFQMRKDAIRKRLLKYTRKAFRMLPKMDKPRILDVGCGSGIPTMQLARLSNGEIIGLDIDQSALDKFARKIKEAGLTDRVKALNCSLFDMEFPDGSFDIIWSEGSMHAIGFERGLREWKRLLKPAGFMVVHDEKGNVEEKIKQISDCGYKLLGYFILDKDIWWDEYFVPLVKLVNETRSKCNDDPELLETLNQAQQEIDMFKQNPEDNTSVCFAMKRK